MATKILVGVTQIDLEPWKSIFERGQKNTWMSRCPEEIEIINLFGQKPNFLLRQFDKFHEMLRLSSLGNGITNRIDFIATKFLNKKPIPDWSLTRIENLVRMDSNTSSIYLTGVIREFSLFKYFLQETKADYLYLTNTSSYVNLSNLLELVETYPREKVHGGTKLPFDNFYFCSGSNRVFSRDVVEFLVKNFNKVNYKYFNDVAIGALLSKENLISVNVPSLTFTSENEILEFDRKQIKNNVHFRLKSGNLHKREDTKLMQIIDSCIFEGF